VVAFGPANFLNRNDSQAQVGALEMPSNGDVLMMLLLTALAGKQPESAPENGLFSAPVDRETSVRLGDEVLPFQ